MKITETGTEHTLGTGWVVDDGSLVTNAHLVQRTETVEIETFDERTGPATRAGYHRDLRPDIALLRTDLETPPPLSVDATATVTTGEPVIAVGHPAPVGDWVISLGRYDSYDPRTRWLLAVVPTADGNSGSPLVTLDGDVVGCVNGTSRTERERARLDRPEAVYTAYESRTTVATATPGKTITEWVSKWR